MGPPAGSQNKRSSFFKVPISAAEVEGAEAASKPALIGGLQSESGSVVKVGLEGDCRALAAQPEQQPVNRRLQRLHLHQELRAAKDGTIGRERDAETRFYK